MECYILAGGQSRRFGEDKLLYRIGDRRTVDYVIEAVRKVCDRVFIVTKDGEKFKDVDAEVVIDKISLQASLVGVYTALTATEEERILIVTGDSPLMKVEVLKTLVSSDLPSQMILFRFRGSIFPFPGVYSRDLLPLVRGMINRKNFRIMDLVHRAKVSLLDADSLDPEGLTFINMNTKEDLNRVLNLLKEKDL